MCLSVCLSFCLSVCLSVCIWCCVLLTVFMCGRLVAEKINKMERKNMADVISFKSVSGSVELYHLVLRRPLHTSHCTCLSAMYVCTYWRNSVFTYCMCLFYGTCFHPPLLLPSLFSTPYPFLPLHLLPTPISPSLPLLHPLSLPFSLSTLPLSSLPPSHFSTSYLYFLLFHALSSPLHAVHNRVLKWMSSGHTWAVFLPAPLV